MSSRWTSSSSRPAGSSWQPAPAPPQQQQQYRESSRESSYWSATSQPPDDRSEWSPRKHLQSHQQQQQQQAQREPRQPIPSNRYRDIPEKPTEPAPSNNAAGYSARPKWHAELKEIADALTRRTANFLSIQAVPWDHDKTQIIELGWSYPDPRRPHASLEDSLITMHFVPTAGVSRRNGMLTQDARAHFLFGKHSLDLDAYDGKTEWNSAQTQRMTLSEIIQRLEETIQRLVKDKQPLYIVLHGSTRGLDALLHTPLITTDWGKTGFGTVDDTDFMALDMNMTLGELENVHQEIRDSKKEHMREEDQRRGANQGSSNDRRDRWDDRSRHHLPVQKSSRFSGWDPHASGRDSDRRGDTPNWSAGPSAPPQQQQQQKKKKKLADDMYDDGFDEWGQPISESESEADFAGIPIEKATSQVWTSKADSNIKIIDTATLMTALGHVWYTIDENPNAKEPEDPTVKDMCTCRTIDLRASPFAKRMVQEAKISNWRFENAGNDAHYTMLALAEMLRQWFDIAAVRGQAAAAVPDLVRTDDSLRTEDRARDRFIVDASKLDRNTPAPPTPAVKRENDGAIPAKNAKKRKNTAASTNNLLEVLIAEYDCLRSVWQKSQSGERSATWIAIDIETWEQDHNFVTELGMSVIYPPAKFDIDFTKTKDDIVASHFIVDENRRCKNGQWVRHSRDHFLVGSELSERAEESQSLMNHSCVASEIKIFEKVRKKLKVMPRHVDEVYLVFHDTSGDLPVLDRWEVFDDVDVQPFFDPETRQHRVPAQISRAGTSGNGTKSTRPRRTLWTVDTQRLMRAYQHSTQTASIKTMCKDLVLHPNIADKWLHNAGNDAFYTLFGMKVMASGPELAELRRQKQEQRKHIPKTVRSGPVLTSWDQEYIEEVEIPAKTEPTAAQAIQPNLDQIPGSQDRLRPLFELSDSWQNQQDVYVAIRTVLVNGQVVELAFSIIDRRQLGRQFEALLSQNSDSSEQQHEQPQRTTHTIDIGNVNLLGPSAHKFHKAFGAMQLPEDRSVLTAANGVSEVLANGTIATSQKRMARQMRAVIAELRKTPGRVHLVFHGPVENTPIPKLGIPNAQLPEDLHDPSAPTSATVEPLEEDEKLAKVCLIDTAVLFERYVEKVETITSADAVVLNGTKPTLANMAEEFILCGGEIDLDNAGNAAHVLLRALSYMATCSPLTHVEGPSGPGPAQQKIARLRALSHHMSAAGPSSAVN
ncbi:hypothetical protein V8E36_009455 [Tilletia maclaganii]